jgi:hypothetical protein
MADSKITPSSVTDQQVATFLASPMSPQEHGQLDREELRLRSALAAARRADLKLGRLLAELKNHPQQLWQRCDLFRRRSGKGWKKHRCWHDFVVAHRLAESGREADQLIAQWEQWQLYSAARKAAPSADA